MLFFEAQRKARNKTGVLIVLFIVNAVLISLLNAFLFHIALHGNFQTLKMVFVGSLLFLVVMSYIASLTIPKGAALVQSMGGRLLSRDKVSPEEKQYMNVVEEMSIASGVPIPHCAVLDEESSINAFVAGEKISEIVVTVTRGALENLSRDELQAVIGHEYSHILNEDLEFNGRLAGVVQGFQFLTRIGSSMTDRSYSRNSNYSFYSSRRNESSVLGLGLMAVGALGYAVGRMIQSWISQQREYLADASSAQYTRNPEALARALGKIVMGQGSALHSSSRHEFAHIFFSDAMGTSFLASLFATHPPLRVRIERLVPKRPLEDILAESATQASKLEDSPIENVAKPQWTAEKVMQCIGSPTEENFQAVGKLMGAMLPHQELLSEPGVARTALGMVFFHSQDSYEVGSQILQESSGISASNFIEIKKAIETGDSQRIVLFQLALGTLRNLSLSEKRSILESSKSLFQQDQKWTLLEALLYLTADKLLLPGKKVSASAPQAPSVAQSLFRGESSVDLATVEGFLRSWEPAPLLKKKDLLTELLKAVDLQRPESREEFRLMALWLGIPVPTL